MRKKRDVYALKGEAVDSFVERLPRARKDERQSLILQKLNELLAQGNLSQTQSILEEIVQLGRKWEHLLAKVLAQQIESLPDSPLAQIAIPFIDLLSREDLVLREKDTGVYLSDLTGLLSRLEERKGSVPIVFGTRFAP